MSKRKPMTTAERLQKKRECEKKRRERIKLNVEATEALKKQKHEIYLRLKREGKVKMIDQLNRRDKKSVRKKWRENARNRRAKIKAAKEFERFQEWSTPPVSSEEELIEENPVHSLVQDNPVPGPSGIVNLNPKQGESSQKKRGRKKVRKDRAACYRENEKLRMQIEKLKRSRDKYKKRCHRAQQKTVVVHKNEELTPKKQVARIMTRNGGVSEEVKKELLWSASMKYNLQLKYRSLQTQREKQIFSKVVGGKILKTYRVVGQCSNFLSRKLFKANAKRLTTFSYERMKSGCKEFIKNKVQLFMENDENSRLCPGKRDVVRKETLLKQKRYLNGTLKDLHAKFVQNNFNISLALFCKFKPFWIVKANVNSRDTCLCEKHENLKLVIQKLHFLKVIKENTTFDVINSLTCVEGRSEKCFRRECSRCRQKEISYSEYDSESSTNFMQWTKDKETRISSKSKKEITVMITSKKTISCTTGQLVRKFQNLQTPFLLHEMKIKHQFDAIKDLKSKLTTKDLLFHVDFSENYLCKYSSEIQSVHFGASRQQIALHTGVVYSTDFKEAFCTMSPALYHSSSAVMAHLKPILEHYLNQCPEVENLHFLSDSVSSQYRNKTVFHLMSSRIPELFPQLKTQTWNYSEAGHGKGAPDGVGGTLKRTADEAVAQGKDIYNFEHFFELVKLKVKKIFLLPIPEESIVAEQTILSDSASTIHKVEGCMQVHQACWASHENRMVFRTLSCFSCGAGEVCSHYHLVTKTMKAPQPALSLFTETTTTTRSAQVGDFVAVSFQDNWYPGEIKSIEDNEVAVIHFMERKGVSKQFFKWPEGKPDEQRIRVGDFLDHLPYPEPVLPLRMEYFKFKNSEDIDTKFSTIS